MREKFSFFKNVVLLCIVGLGIILLFCAIVFYLLSFKVKPEIVKGESLRFRHLAYHVLDDPRHYAEGLLNSYAMWEKFARAVERRDVAWLKNQLLEDPQVARCDGVGVILSNGDVLISRGLKLPKEIALELLKEIKRRFPLGREAEHFFHTLLKINGKIWLVSISPLGNDESVIISYNALYFATSQDSLIKRLNRLFPGARLCKRPVKCSGLVEAVPWKDYKGRVLAWVTAPIAGYIQESFEDLLLSEGFIVTLVVAYVLFVFFLLRSYHRAMVGYFNGVVDTLVGIAELNDADLSDIEELALRDDEVGRMARRLAPLMRNISSCLLTDPLTGAYNRRVFFSRLGEELERFRRYKRPFCLVLLDIDDFKKVNDTYGHPFGDLVLAQFSHLIKENIRSSDVFARIGGEEFGVMLVETNINAAFKVCEKLRAAVEQATFKGEGRSVRITASFGVTQAREADTVKSLYERADRALYMAKQAGKNRVVYLP